MVTDECEIREGEAAPHKCASGGLLEVSAAHTAAKTASCSPPCSDLPEPVPLREHRHCSYSMQTKISPAGLSSAQQRQHLASAGRRFQSNGSSRRLCRARALGRSCGSSSARHRRARHSRPRGSGEQQHIPPTLPLPGPAPPRKGPSSPSGAAEKQKWPRAAPGGAALTEQQSGVHAVEEHPADHRPAQKAQGPSHEDVVHVRDVLADVGGQVGEGGSQHGDAHPLQGRVGVTPRPGEGSPQRRGRPRSPFHSPAPGRRRRAPR